MAVDRTPTEASLADLLDRVIDKGIIIDAYVGVSLMGLDLVSVEARVVVASVETYLRHGDRIRVANLVSRPLPNDGSSFTRVWPGNQQHPGELPRGL